MDFFSCCLGESRSSSTLGAVDGSVVATIGVVFAFALDNPNDEINDFDTVKVPVNELKDKTTLSDLFL